MMHRPANEYIVVIPSYQRPHHLAERALPMLLGGGVSPKRIHVYLHDNDPMLAKYATLARDTGVQLVITGERGITAQRTRITQDYRPGTPIVSMDDDVTELMEALDKKTLARVGDVDQLFQGMFTETAARDLWVWGLAPVVNAYFMNPGRISDGLKFLIFTCYGFFNRPGHPVHQHTVPYKDEHELSLRAWWYDGAAVRHDGIAARANFWTLDGGCQAAGRSKAEVEYSVQSLLEQWPGLVRINHKRKSDYTEIVLAAKKRHAGNSPDTPPPGVAATPKIGG